MNSPKRLIVAGVILPLLFLYIYFLPPSPYFLILLMCVSIITMYEFYVMYRLPRRLYLPGISIGAILFYLFCRYPYYFQDAIFFTLLLILVLRLIIVSTPSGSIKEIGILYIGFLYISWFLSFQWLLMNEAGKGHIFFLYGSVWLGDSMAYYAGTYLGKNKLYPAISPNKTFEGAVGSILGGAIGGVIIKLIFNIHEFAILKALLIGAILGAVAVIGDLIESMFKRDAGVKDSSNLITGHGGILDKIDSLLIAGPILYFIVRSM